MTATCLICNSLNTKVVYQSQGDYSINTLCQLYPAQTKVHLCSDCGHVQTDEIMDLHEYYAYAYNLHTDSSESDSLYKMESGKPIYRMDYQAQVFQHQVSLSPAARVLEYGCAKAGTLERVFKQRPDIVPFAFDVSDNYRSFWERFLPAEQMASFTTPEHWDGTMDVVMSYFVLEHVSDIHGVIQHMKRLLKPTGVLYAIVPNCLVNIADLVVVDHVNHFTIPSLLKTLALNDLTLVSLDTQAYEGGLVLIASQSEALADVSGFPSVAESNQQIEKLADYWCSLSSRIASFEASRSTTSLHHEPVAIYGSGFYGTYIATCLKDFEAVSCFIDQNPYRQKETLMNKPIVAPETLGQEIQWIYVGLRPEIAKENIQAIDAWKGIERQYFYL
jgi:SAM-dependent methyltransferase